MIVDLAALVTAAGTDLSKRGEKITVNDNADATVQDGLDAIAKAYGFEGSTEEFLALRRTIEDATDPTKDVTYSMVEMLVALSQKPGSTDPDVLPTFPNAKPDDDTSFETSGRSFTGVTITFNSNNGDFLGINGQQTMSTSVLKVSDLGGNFSDITIDFSELSEPDNKGTSTASATSGDLKGLGAGRRLGKMIGVSIQQNGMIYASYDNGMTKLLGQIATASFPNASGLEKQGDNMYAATLNSGEFDGIGVDITASGGKMSTGQLEMSNVDLSSEFTEMITTQRGFQANSRIITVSDTLLEELTNLKR